MAIALRATANTEQAAGPSTISLPVPAGTVAGDVILWFVGMAGSTAPSTPTGLTLLNRGTGGPYQNVYYRVADGTEPSAYTLSPIGTSSAASVIARSYSGVDNTTPINASSGPTRNTTSKNSVASTITTTVNGAMLVYAANSGATATTFTDPTGFANDAYVGINDGFAAPTVTSDATQTTAGATGTETGTWSGSNRNSQATLVALAPAAGGGGVTNNDSGSGTITLSGSRVEAHLVSDAGSGTISLTGSAVESSLGSGAASGTMTLAGAVTEAHAWTDAAAGTIHLSGTGVDAHQWDDSAAGTILFGGSGTDSFAHGNNDLASGTLTLGGSSSEAHLVADSAAGTIFLHGSGTDSFSGANNDSASGTILLSGSKVDSLSMVDSGAGTFTLGGSGVDARGYLDQPVGTLHLGGSGSDIYSTSWAPTSTLFFSGADFDTWIGGQIALAISLLLGDNGTLQTLRWRIVQATLDNSYPTGGYALTPDEMDFKKIRLLLPIPYGGYIFQWTGNKLMAFQQSGSVGPLIEVPAGTDLSSESLDLFIIGDHI